MIRLLSPLQKLKKKKDYPKIRWGGGHSKMFLVEGKAIIDMDTNVT